MFKTNLNKTKIRVALYQGLVGGGLPYRDLEQILSFKPDFTVLPEYFWTRQGMTDSSSAARGFLSVREEARELSRKIPGHLICGTTIEPENGCNYNTSLILKNGQIVGKHRKVHLFGNEREILTAGDGFRLYNLGGINCGILICADALQVSSFIRMRELGAGIIFCPTFSEVNPDDNLDAKLARDRDIYLKGAQISGAAIVKCCSVGTLFGHKANGRSLICTLEDFIYRSDEQSEKEVRVITAVFEI